ncbi:hypothetical protein B0H14DRAFT_400740 [Mycena olivaceomarginata]|nr:hypothetical protein B0H14DRAFT_400740 [Mycena olivaceomarginata]
MLGVRETQLFSFLLELVSDLCACLNIFRSPSSLTYVPPGRIQIHFAMQHSYIEVHPLPLSRPLPCRRSFSIPNLTSWIVIVVRVSSASGASLGAPIFFGTWVCAQPPPFHVVVAVKCLASRKILD